MLLVPFFRLSRLGESLLRLLSPSSPKLSLISDRLMRLECLPMGWFSSLSESEWEGEQALLDLFCRGSPDRRASVACCTKIRLRKGVAISASVERLPTVPWPSVAPGGASSPSFGEAGRAAAAADSLFGWGEAP